MNMIRGAVAFLLVFAVFALAECKNDQNSPADPSRSGGRAHAVAVQQKGGGQPGQVPTSTCTNTTTDMQFCAGATADCVVTLNVSSDTGDNTVTAPDKVWIDSGQKVIWQGVEDNNTARKVKVKRVHFRLTDDPHDQNPKKGDKKLISEADCQGSDDCVKSDGSEFTPCVSYAYTAILHHNNKDKRKDPEIEVGSTNCCVTNTTGTSGTSTSGTTGTH